jgi:acetolactate synthase-1/2/3 large subunit
MKYSEYLMDRLVEHGYTHCFFVAGGNSMHLLDAARKRMRCIPFVHEVSAAIAAEYFNETQIRKEQRAFVMVTAGPGLTNAITGIAGAYLESRELLVLGGQVKSTDLASGGLRQRGIQEIDGVSAVRPFTKLAKRLDSPITGVELDNALRLTSEGRPGPVFLELCLDTQAREVEKDSHSNSSFQPVATDLAVEYLTELSRLIQDSQRPVLLIGGGISRSMKATLMDVLSNIQVPTMTTWNGADRISSDHPLYFGRPNTWGQRSSNILLQQSDLVVALGTRLGLQQTGFNWREFAPVAKVVQVDIDPAELEKGHPSIYLGLCTDANKVLSHMKSLPPQSWSEWVDFAVDVRSSLPLSEDSNSVDPRFINSYDFVLELSKHVADSDLVVPCSSGGAFTVMMQAFMQKANQTIITNKGLASMGYGLAGAVGAALAQPRARVVLVEGDGGFSQNLQELATVSRNRLNVKMFVFANNGYASIRMTQTNYFGGQYLGCDTESGLGFPNWKTLAETYQIPFAELTSLLWQSDSFMKAWSSPDPLLVMVPIDPVQTYFPKISSRVTTTGSMESAPLHLMTPDLDERVHHRVFKYLRS